jgi:hypothetical protein
MHVDGGTTNQVFLFPTEMRIGGVDAKLGIDPVRRLYIIRNGRVAPEFKAVKASTLAIAGRSISTLIKTQGIGDLYQMYELAQRNRIRRHPHPNPCRAYSCPGPRGLRCHQPRFR